MIAKIANKQSDLNVCYKYIDLGNKFKIYSEKIETIFRSFSDIIYELEKKQDKDYDEWSLYYGLFLVASLSYFQDSPFPWEEVKKHSSTCQELVIFLYEYIEKRGDSHYEDISLSINPQDAENLSPKIVDFYRLTAICYSTPSGNESIKIIYNQTVYIINNIGATVDVYKS